jgi:hypothetical protein
VNRRRRSRRSYVVEAVLIAVAIGLIFAFYTFRWYEPLGRWLAEQFTR